MASQTLLIRADANVEIGTGHVMRCLALAQAWLDRGGDVAFAMAESIAGIDDRLQSERLRIVNVNATPGSVDDAATTTQLARSMYAVWTVVDGYRFDSAYQRFLKDEGLKLLVLDDYGHARHYWADAVLNQNISANESVYASREEYTRLLLGLDYVLLRSEFKAWRSWKREIAPVARKVLVTMGGSDPDNLTERVIGVLNSMDVANLETRVVVGGGNPHLRSLESSAAGVSRRVQLVHHTFDMPELMAWADLAIVAAGGTLWELLFMGCPTLSLGRDFVQNQLLWELSREHLIKFAGHSQEFNPARLAKAVEEMAASSTLRMQMSMMGRQKLDGLGAERVCEQMIEVPVL